jgi:hypothetical protein
VNKIYIRQITTMYIYIRAGEIVVTFDCNLNIEITAPATLQNTVCEMISIKVIYNCYEIC